MKRFVPLMFLFAACADELPADRSGVTIMTVPVHLDHFAQCGAWSHGATFASDVTTRDAPQGFVDLSLETEYGGVYCYSIAVETHRGELVWQADDLCASEFGVPGAMAYIGTCAPAADGRDAINRVVVAVDRACDRSGNILDVPVPCEDGCATEFTCRANGDTRVTFDIPRPGR